MGGYNSIQNHHPGGFLDSGHADMERTMEKNNAGCFSAARPKV